jgi:hypothetical protein
LEYLFLYRGNLFIKWKYKMKGKGWVRDGLNKVGVGDEMGYMCIYLE